MLWLIFYVGGWRWIGGKQHRSRSDDFRPIRPPRGRSFGRRFRQEGGLIATRIRARPWFRGSGWVVVSPLGHSEAKLLGSTNFFVFRFFSVWFGVPNGRKSGQCLKTRRGTKSQWLVTQTCRRAVRLSSTNPFPSDIAYSEAPGAHRSLTRNSAKMVLSQYDYIFAIGTFFALLDA